MTIRIDILRGMANFLSLRPSVVNNHTQTANFRCFAEIMMFQIFISENKNCQVSDISGKYFFKKDT